MSKATMTIEGFVAQDPELRNHNGKSVVNITVPHTPRRLNKQTNKYEDAGDTLWVQASFWEQQAEAIAVQVSKGTLVTITGIPELHTYPKNDGTTGAQIRLVFGTLGVIPRAEQRQQQVQEPWATPGSQGNAGGGSYGDDTPF